MERLNEIPDDEALRNEIRTLDLLVRKAYFTNQWQIRMGGYLLILSIVIAVIAYRTANSLQNTLPQPIISETGGKQLSDIANQKWTTIGGAVILGVALLLVFLSHRQLGNNFNKQLTKDMAQTTDTIQDNSVEIAQTEPEIEQDTTTVSDSIPATDTTNIETSEPQTEYPTYKEIYQNYPSFRGAGGNGISYQKGAPTQWDGKSGKNIIWKTAIPIHGYSSPVIWENKVFLTGANASSRELYCFDLETGKILWTGKANQIKNSPATPPKVTDDTGLAAATVATDGRRVYAIFGTGDIVCFDMDGKRLWAKNNGVPQNHYGHSSSIIAYRNLLYIQYDQRRSAKIMALDTKTGKTVWSTDRKVKISWASPVLVNTGKRMELILCSDPLVVSYNPFSGKELWSIKCLSGEVGPSAAYSNGIVFAANEYAKLVAIRLGETPEVIWENDEVLPDVASPVATKDYVFAAASYGSVVCMDAQTGEQYWGHDYDEGFYASPVINGGKLYLLDISGIMHVVAVDKTFKTIAKNNLGEAVYSTPAFAENKILIRGDNHLYCIGKK